MDTLEQISEKIDLLTLEVEQYFKTLNTPSNIILAKDRKWGLRQIDLPIRLDEFTLEKFIEHVPTIQKLLDKFRILRQNERELIDKAEITKRIESDIMNKTW